MVGWMDAGLVANNNGCICNYELRKRDHDWEFNSRHDVYEGVGVLRGVGFCPYCLCCVCGSVGGLFLNHLRLRRAHLSCRSIVRNEFKSFCGCVRGVLLVGGCAVIQRAGWVSVCVWLFLIVCVGQFSRSFCVCCCVTLVLWRDRGGVRLFLWFV